MTYVSSRCSLMSHAASADVSDVCMFGFTNDMQYAGPEFLALASLRFSCRGDREVICCHAPALWQLLQKHNAVDNEQLSSDRPVTTVIGEKVLHAKMDDAWVRELLSSTDPKMFYKGVVPENGLIFTPAGMIVLERTLNKQCNVGIRLTINDQSLSSLENLQTLRGIHMIYADQSCKLAEHWGQVLTS